MMKDESPVLRVGISSCLLGEEVRFDGGHKRNRFLLNTLGEYVQWFPICPEVEIGLGVPRESLRLIGSEDDPRLVAPRSGSDHTEAMQNWSAKQLEAFEELDLHGFIFKKDSPSCGLFNVRVYPGEKKAPSRNGRGIFAKEFVRMNPLLPVEEEGRLNDMPLRENFVERLFAHQRWQELMRSNPTSAGLVEFHSNYKLTLMAHSPSNQRSLGKLVADAGNRSWPELANEYGLAFMQTLSELASPKKHANVLHHLMGYLKTFLNARDKEEMLSLIEQYRTGLLPLIVPITLLRHHLDRFPVPEWVTSQVYLNPYPKELMLRNHV